MDDLEKVFGEIAEKNLWGSAESVSGTGSTLDATEKVREWLPRIMTIYNIRTIVDAPCGDVNWMSKFFPLFDEWNIHYQGIDIVSSIIKKNKEKHNYDNVVFDYGDITQHIPANHDLVIMRDVIGHLSTINGITALENVKRSGARWLLTTVFPNVVNITEENNGGWRLVNLLSAPYMFNPELVFNEHCKEGNSAYDNKCMALFDVRKLPLGVW